LEVSKRVGAIKANGIELFCFLRKNLPGNSDIEYVIQYMKDYDYDNNIWNDAKVERLFDKFKEEFHTGRVIVNNIKNMK